MKHFFAASALFILSTSAFATSFEDRIVCEGMDPSVDRAACMKEMRNARAEEKRGGLTAPQGAPTARCSVMKNQDDYDTCVRRVTKGQVSGKVESGGTITELREVVPETK